MNKIIQINSARHMDGEEWQVGKEIGYKSGLFITEIKDTTAEFPDSIEYQFDIYVNDELWKTLINMPVQVEYEIGGDK